MTEQSPAAHRSEDERAHFNDLDLTALTDAIRANVEITDRRYRLKTYKQCFIGSELCQWLVDSGTASDEQQALLIGNVLLDADVFHHVLRDHAFKNEQLFYRFTADEDHGKITKRPNGSFVSWSDFAPTGLDRDTNVNLQTSVQEDPTIDLMYTDKVHGVTPLDEHNTELLDQVHPPSWQDPIAKPRYNMVVLGAGTAGLVTAAAAAGLGARVALVEGHLMGGDCLNVGCVPSKALLSCAKAVAQVRDAAKYGVRLKAAQDDPDALADAIEVDFNAVMTRLRKLRAKISHHDSATRFSKDLGVDVFIGRGQFTGPNTLEINGQTLHFAKACIATGGAPTVPPIEGLDTVPYLTNHSIFNLTERPPRLGVIGAGVIGIEMAQAFQRLGSQVTVIERGERILSREDQDAAQILQDTMTSDGVTFAFNSSIARISSIPTDGAFDLITVHTDQGDLPFDALLVATGRKPNVEGIGLEKAGVEFDTKKGVIVNDRLQTTNSDIFAAGDVATRYQFTHTADFMARIVVRNALFFGRDKFSNLLIPWCTYTQPEIAHVGLYPSDLDARKIEFKTFTKAFSDVDRAIVETSTKGFVRVHVSAGSDKILGATVVGEHAGDLISEITLAMSSDTGLGSLASVIHPYPTRAEAIRQVGDLYNRTRLTQTVKNIFRRLMDLKR